MDALEAIFNRHSVRKYKDLPIEPEKIELLLKAGMSAPSACNQQPWELYVVTDKQKLDELSKCSPFARPVRDAALAIVPCRRKNDLRAEDFAVQDMSACTENILVAAESLGLGAVWLGIAPVEKRMAKVADVLDLPENLAVFSIISLGYSDETPTERSERYNKNLVHYL